MREKLQPKVEDLSENGYDFKFGDYINEAFHIFGKYAGGFIGFILIYFVMTSMVNAIPLIGPLVNLVVAPTLIAGLYIVAHKIQTNQYPEFGDFFEGFQRFGDIAIPSIITSLIYFASIIPFIIALYFSWDVFREGGWENFIDGSTAFDLNFPYWTLLLILPVIYLSIAYMYTIMFVLFYDARPWEAIEASRRIVTKNWFIIFLFMFVIGIIAILGMVALFVGILATMPIAIIATYVSFADITDLINDENSEDELMDHLVV